jgi:hypothetical protein
MELDVSRRQLKLDKELNELDRLVLDFTKVLDRNKIHYVLVSGYVSILFGRSRSSEDIDILVQRVSERRFLQTWKEAKKSFDCLTVDDAKMAYERYLSARSALRFSRKGEVIPNIEFKFPKVELDEWVIRNARKVLLNGSAIRISPIELQIAYKLLLASEKDIEDARYIYRLFQEKLDAKLLKYFVKKLDKQDEFKRYIE